jgi:succinate dehydrogenase / fumarate reductase cytochrome b subunit
VSEHATHESPSENPSQSILEKHAFLFRRLHSLSGIIPVGLFVMMHLFTNFQMAAGDFQHEVEFIHSLPALLIVEWALWLGIGFHAVLGIIYTMTGRTNTHLYPLGGNWRYALQRATGYIALLFILVHVATLRWRFDMFGWFTPFFVAGPDGTPLSMATTAKALQFNVAVLLVYILGVAAVIFHWSNGLWTAAITWGATVTVAAQRRWGYVCAVIGITLTLFSAGGIVAALKYHPGATEEAAITQAQDGYKDGRPLMEKSREIFPETNAVQTPSVHPPGVPGVPPRLGGGPMMAPPPLGGPPATMPFRGIQRPMAPGAPPSAPYGAPIPPPKPASPPPAPESKKEPEDFSKITGNGIAGSD